MKVDYSRQFRKQYEKLPKKVQTQFKQRVALLFTDPTDSALRVRKLSGPYEGLWSMHVTGDVRAIFDKSFEGVLLFVAIGTHSELYS